jgi:hypothetical protein
MMAEIRGKDFRIGRAMGPQLVPQRLQPAKDYGLVLRPSQVLSHPHCFSGNADLQAHGLPQTMRAMTHLGKTFGVRTAAVKFCF